MIPDAPHGFTLRASMLLVMKECASHHHAQNASKLKFINIIKIIFSAEMSTVLLVSGTPVVAKARAEGERFAP